MPGETLAVNFKPRNFFEKTAALGYARIDQGSEPTVLYPHYAQTVPDRWTINASDYSIKYVGGQVVAQELQMKDFSFGPLEFAHVYVLVPESSVGELQGYDGVIGQIVLSYYVMYLDYAHRQIFLQSNA